MQLYLKVYHTVQASLEQHLKINKQTGVIARAYNPSTQQLEVRKSGVQGHPLLPREVKGQGLP